MKLRTTFKIGEVVELKSGSPKMTTTEIVAHGKVRCSWFVGSKHTSGIFPPKALQIPGEDPRDVAMREAGSLVYGPQASTRRPALRAPA